MDYYLNVLHKKGGLYEIKTLHFTFCRYQYPYFFL